MRILLGQTETTVHRYRVVFDPAFENGTSPSAVRIDVQHMRNGEVIATAANSSYVVAGGEIDVILSDEPEFLDQIYVEVSTTEATCSRSLDMTMWNQPASDHEITRCLLYTSPSPRDATLSRMPSSA